MLLFLTHGLLDEFRSIFNTFVTSLVVLEKELENRDI